MDERTVDWKCSRLLGRIVHWNRLNCLPDYVIVCPMSGMDNEDRLRVVGIFEKLVGKHGIECVEIRESDGQVIIWFNRKGDEK